MKADASGNGFSYLNTIPNTPPYDENGEPYWLPDNSNFSSPLSMLNYDGRNDVTSMNASFNSSYRFWNQLTAKVSLGYSYNSGSQHNLYERTYYHPTKNNQYNQARYFDQNSSTFIIEPQLTYGCNIIKGKADFLIGATYQRSDTHVLFFYGQKYPGDIFLKDANSASLINMHKNPATQTKSASLFGRITYDYATRYMVDFNIGYNGSENFAEGKRYGTFPSFSVGWIPSSEKFWEPIKPYIGYLKLRGSWGMVGNDNTNGARFLYLPGAWQFYTGATTVNPQKRGANFGTSGNWLQAVKELTAGNPNVTWETATKINLGLDAAFLKDRLTVNLDLFWEDRKDILVSNASMLPAVTTLPSSYVNEGRVKNHGYELTLKWADRIGDLRYSISPSIAFARNKVIEMLEVPPMYDYLRRTGLPVGQRFAYDLFEFYQPGTEQRYKEKYGVDMPDQVAELRYGDAVYVDLNDDGVIDQNDQKPLGYTDNPEITWSVNANLNWKGFDFSMLWVGADNTSRALNGYFRDQFGSTNTSALAQWVADNSWTEDNPNAILPRISFTNRVHNNRDSQAWVIDSKYVRLKNLELGYTINKPKWLDLLNYVRFYVSGQNLLTFADFKGNDPEAPGSGLDFGVRYPMTRVYNFGLQVNF